MSPKIAIPVVLGLAGASAVTATALTTNVFSSPKKCWYDDEEPDSFLERVDKVLKENHGGKDNSELKKFIGTLCTLDPESSLKKFNEKFSEGNYDEVYGLLMGKWLSIKNDGKDWLLENRE